MPCQAGSGVNLLGARPFFGGWIRPEHGLSWKSGRAVGLLRQVNARRTLSVVTLAGIVDAERRFEEEKTRIEARYRKVLKSSVEFEKRIRNRWRQKNREKNGRIAGLEVRLVELERELENAKDQSRE